MTPLVIVAVVVSYLVSEALTAYVDERIGAEPPGAEPAARKRAGSAAAT